MFQISAVKTENCFSDFDLNAVENETRYNKSGNNMLTAKAKKTWTQQKTLAHVTVLF